MTVIQCNIKNESSWFDDDTILKIEDKYNATYVFESCLKDAYGNWANFPVAIFYTEEAHPEGSNYFGLYLTEDKTLVSRQQNNLFQELWLKMVMLYILVIVMTIVLLMMVRCLLMEAETTFDQVSIIKNNMFHYE